MVDWPRWGVVYGDIIVRLKKMAYGGLGGWSTKASREGNAWKRRKQSDIKQ